MWAGLINPAGWFLPKPSKMWKSGLEGRQTSADKTTPKLVTEQLRASQKVLNKSDQFIPVVPGCAGWSGERTGRILAVHQWEGRLGRLANERAVWDGTQLAGPPATNLTAPNPLLGWKFKPWCRVQMFFSQAGKATGQANTLWHTERVSTLLLSTKFQPNPLKITLLLSIVQISPSQWQTEII